jgi:hypothetical protein
MVGVVPLLAHMGYVGGGVIAGVVGDAIGYGACHRRRGLAHSHVRPLGALRHAGAIHSGTNRLTPEAAPHTPAMALRPVIGCKSPTISVDDAAAIAIDQAVRIPAHILVAPVDQIAIQSSARQTIHVRAVHDDLVVQIEAA